MGGSVTYPKCLFCKKNGFRWVNSSLGGAVKNLHPHIGGSHFTLLSRHPEIRKSLARVGAGALEALLVLAVVLGHLPHLVVVISPGESFESVREESSTGGVELLSVVLGQLGPEGVDRDDERP